jgi:hypothetical protein
MAPNLDDCLSAALIPCQDVNDLQVTLSLMPPCQSGRDEKGRQSRPMTRSKMPHPAGHCELCRMFITAMARRRHCAALFGLPIIFAMPVEAACFSHRCRCAWVEGVSIRQMYPRRQASGTCNPYHNS